MSDPAANPPAPATPEPDAAVRGAAASAVPLGDGTVLVLGPHGTVRLSESRTRWWNGRLWERTAESTPWAAAIDETGTKWWDGVSWQPRRKSLARWRHPRPLAVLQCAVPVLVAVLLAIAGAGSGLGFLGVVVVHLGMYFSLVTPSRVLAGRVKNALFLGVFGMAIVGVMDLWRRLTAGTPEVRPPVRKPA